MAPSKKSSKSAERKAHLEQLRRQQVAAERRRTFLVLGVCLVVGVAIVAAVAIPLLRDDAAQARLDSRPLTAIGASPQQAGCRPLVTHRATGNNDHRTPGQKIFYDASPPAYGPHYPVPAPMARKFYTPQDRPRVETLVHNLEHGYNIVWYDHTVAADQTQVQQLQAIAKKFPGTSKLENKFIVAPWTTDDGQPFPRGAHVAITHWSIGGDHPDPQHQIGVWQYCDAISGQAVSDFTTKYPYTDSPEPAAM